MDVTNKKCVIQSVQSVLAADLSCSTHDLLSDHVSVHRAEQHAGGFRFPYREQSLSILTLGKGAAISCNEERMAWAQHELGQISRDQLFSVHTMGRIDNYLRQNNQYLAGPDLKYVCTIEDLRDLNIPRDVTITIHDCHTVSSLYAHKQFQHALTFNPNSDRPDMLAAVAEYKGATVGIAGASADCDTMWQIGVDVLPEYQGLGIGKAIVGRLTRAILEEGIIPYYSTSLHNLQSRQLAVSLGYWPAWMQLYARYLE
ncbi:GNAT family N-acetyltransferase [Paenibacillus marinisediminis]